MQTINKPLITINTFIGNIIAMLRVKQDLFSRATSSICACPDIIFSSVFVSQSASNSGVSEISEVVLTFFYVRNVMGYS